MKRDGGSVFPASANTGDPTGPVEAYRASALISMMARSQRSKQKPDTLMQDRSPPTRRNLLATHGRTIHSGHSLPMHSPAVSHEVRIVQKADEGPER
jgi:hypothetical protein